MSAISEASGGAVGTSVPTRGERRAPQVVEVGSAVVKIYGRSPGPYTITWRKTATGPRQRTMRAQWKAAKAFATRLARDLANGQTAMSEFTDADRASYRRALELLAPTGQGLELAAAIYAEAVAKLEDVPVMEAIRFFLENRPRGYVPRPIPMLVEQFLNEKRGEISRAYHANLEHQLERLAGDFTGPLHLLTSADLNGWVRGLGLSPRSRHNYRAAVETFTVWARQNGHLPKTWCEMEHVPDPGTKTGEIKILTPDQMISLLATRQRMEKSKRSNIGSLIPFLALQAFAGIRHEEINGDHAKLTWGDINLKERYIYVSKGVAKTWRDRTVPISDNLAAWLAPYERRNGPITEMSQTSDALQNLKELAGVPAHKGETRNALRKSYISYRKAITKNIAMVADEAGNSAQMIRKHYGRIIPESEAVRWFNIWPQTAAVLQLTLFSAPAAVAPSVGATSPDSVIAAS